MANKKKNDIKMTVRPNFMWIWAVLIMIIIGYSFYAGSDTQPLAGNWNTVRKMIRNGEVERITVIDGQTANVYLTEEAIEKYRNGGDEVLKRMPKEGEQLIFNIGSVELLDNDVKEAVAESGIEENPVSIEYKNESNPWGNIIVNLLPWVILIGIWFFIIRTMSRGGGGAGGNIMNVGKARAQVFDKDDAGKRSRTSRDWRRPRWRSWR